MISETSSNLSGATVNAHKVLLKPNFFELKVAAILLIEPSVFIF